MEIVEMERSEMESVEMERNVTRWTLDSADQSWQKCCTDIIVKLLWWKGIDGIQVSLDHDFVD